MRRSSLYGHVAELFELVAASRQPADTVVDHFTRTRHYLGAKDRRFISALLYDLLRHHARLSAYVQHALTSLDAGHPHVRITGIALCAAHAVRLEGRTGADVFTDLAGLWRTTTTEVDPLRFFAALAAVELPGLKSTSPVDRLSIKHSLPPRLVEGIVGRWGEEEGGKECAALNCEAPVTVRVNTLKCRREECRDEFSGGGITVRPTLRSPEGLLLERRVHFGALGLFRNGWCEPQDEGSQLLSHVLRPETGETIVDACAGGGGKTLHCAALMKNSGRIFALDVDPSRLGKLDARLRRAGISIAQMQTVPAFGSLPSEWIGMADGVLVDAPCTGTGTYRRNPAAKLRFEELDLSSMVQLQESLLSRSADLVRSGGRLVYSTCSLLPEENEEVVRRFLSMRTDFRTVDAVQILREQGIEDPGGGPMLFLTPHRHGTDGFFAAAMVRATV